MKIHLIQDIIDLFRLKKNCNILSTLKIDLIHFKYYFYNYIITNLPSYILRRWYLKNILGYKLAKRCFVHLGCYFWGDKIEIGEGSVIGRNCTLSGDIKIGKNCSITAETFIQTSSHILNSPDFKGCSCELEIGNWVWIGVRSVIVPGVEYIKDGAVIGANSTVVKNVEYCSVVAGSPAQEIKKRDENALQYELNYMPKWN